MLTPQQILELATKAQRTLVDSRNILAIRAYHAEGEFIAISVKLGAAKHWALTPAETNDLCKHLIFTDADQTLLRQELIDPMQRHWDEWIEEKREVLREIMEGIAFPTVKAIEWTKALRNACTYLDTNTVPGEGKAVYSFSKLGFFGRSGGWLGLLDTEELDDLLYKLKHLIEDINALPATDYNLNEFNDNWSEYAPTVKEWTERLDGCGKLTELVTEWVKEQSFADYVLHQATQLLTNEYDNKALATGSL